MQIVKKPTRDFNRVLRYAERVGVKVVLGQPPDMVQSTQAPYHNATIAKIWGTMVVYWWQNGTTQVDWAYALLHEVGHVLTGEWPTMMEDGETVAGLVAHDYHVGRYLRLSGWQDWMAGYEIGRTAYTMASFSERCWELKKSRKGAVKNGLLTKDLKPVFGRAR